MNYQETIDFLYARLPMFTRVGDVALKKGLGNIQALVDVLHQPHTKFSTIHVAGTNGKGSVSHMLAAILQQAGYKTGLYTSPHLKDFRERIKVNGEMMEEAAVVDFVAQNQTSISEIQPSFFEVTVAMAFDYFAKQNVDVAIIEVGLGGRLDSTNIILPDLSVITNIGFDHVQLLGNTLPEIAFEKAGIIKNGVPVVIGEYIEETKPVFEQKARQCNTSIRYAVDEVEINQSFFKNKLLHIGVNVKGYDTDLELDLVGIYQLKNIKTVYIAIDELRKQGYHISDAAFLTALKNVKALTGLMGRWQTLSERPLVICDTGHNEDGIREILRQINLSTFQRLHMVIGMVKDKEIGKILQLLPAGADYYFCQPQIDRAKPAEELKQEAEKFGLSGKAYPTIQDALDAAKRAARSDDFIFVGGSTFVVAEVL